MAEILVSVIVDEILSKVTSVLGEEVGLARDFKAELTRLGKSLAMIQAFLHDAGKRQVTDEAVKLWLKNLTAVACDARDALDDFGYDNLHRQVWIRDLKTREVRNFFSLNNPIVFRLKMAHKVRSINVTLEFIRNEANHLGLSQRLLEMPAYETVDVRETHSFVDHSHVVGRKDEISNIINMLVDSNNQETLSVFSIVGMAGLGKTTIAQLVSKAEQVKAHFDVIIWLSVSDRVEVKWVLRNILQFLTKSECRVDTVEFILENLENHLAGKKSVEEFKADYDDDDDDDEEEEEEEEQRQQVSYTNTTISVFPCLEELIVDNCPQLKTVPSHHGFPSLKKLEIGGTKSGSSIVEMICSNVTTLTSLNIQSVGYGLSRLPPGILRNNKNLTSLYIHKVGDLESIVQPQEHQNISWGCWAFLRSLSIQSCYSLERIPNMQGLMVLEDLHIYDCPNLISIPDLRDCYSLSSIRAKSCRKLTSISGDEGGLGIGYLLRLERLEMGPFSEELDYFPGLSVTVAMILSR